jgi:hypothetical protein
MREREEIGMKRKILSEISAGILLLAAVTAYCQDARVNPIFS